MNDKEFLDYCYHHARTPRHLFSVHDSRRLCELAGVPEHRGTVKLAENDIIGMDPEFVDWRVEEARKRLKEAEAKPVED